MIKLTNSALLVLTAFAQDGDYGPPARALSAESARGDLALLGEAIEVIHPGLGRYAPAAAFEKELAALRARVEDGTTDLALYHDISLLLAGLRCGHTRAEAPGYVDSWRARST